MASANFRFKQFTVWHDRCAMKVGTDGVLLGAWCPIVIDGFQNNSERAFRILDIGTGSGLIALMLAQRMCTGEHIALNIRIDAIDVDAEAVEQATYNCSLSPWAKHLHVYHSTLQMWKKEEENEEDKYDLIVSNPPYFQSSLKNPDAQRATARHTDSLNYSELIRHSERLLKENAILALVLPIEAEKEILSMAAIVGLSPIQITYVHTKPRKNAKRILIALKRNNEIGTIKNSHFYIESEDSPRSEEYRKLTEDFYL